MNKQDRMEELQEMRQEFIINEMVTPDNHPSWQEVAEASAEAESKWDATNEGKELKALEDSQVDTVFRKFPDGDVIAFLYGYSVSKPEYIMSYMHIGQHSEAHVRLIDELDLCTDEEIKALKNELESIGYIVNIIYSEDDDYGYAEQKNFD
jgi:hypothetical protein